MSTKTSLRQGLQKLELFAFIDGFNINWLDFALVTAVHKNVLE